MRLSLASALVLALASGASAQSPSYDAKFAREIIDAINSRTVEARATLVQPASRACITGDVGEWWRDSVLRWAETPVPADRQWTMMTLSADEARVASDRFDWPLAPTHALQLVMRDSPSSSRTPLIRVAQDGARWAEVVPCAKPETVRAIRARKGNGAR
ncbi:MAG TPA: hypothetical protein VFL90_09330 [Methylomirabilota bacterium]|nr:hypothetical protein [Methylomirabilota bacterium]